MFTAEPWWSFLEPTQQELLKQSFLLLAWAKKNQARLSDFSFMVMPAAKAYEGYLKKFLFSLKLISPEDYNQDRFRIGKALNPELEAKFPDECLFNEVSRACDPQLARDIWDTWKRCRNRLLHYFPGEQQIFTLRESEERLQRIVDTIRKSYQYINTSEARNPKLETKSNV